MRVVYSASAAARSRLIVNDDDDDDDDVNDTDGAVKLSTLLTNSSRPHKMPIGLHHCSWLIIVFFHRIALHFISCLVLYCFVVQCTIVCLAF